MKIHQVKHSRYTHIVIAKPNSRIEDVISNLHVTLKKGMILLDTKESAKSLSIRFWEVSVENGKIQYWKLEPLKDIGKNLFAFCEQDTQGDNL